jgi:hypothetical protein
MKKKNNYTFLGLGLTFMCPTTNCGTLLTAGSGSCPNCGWGSN